MKKGLKQIKEAVLNTALLYLNWLSYDNVVIQPKIAFKQPIPTKIAKNAKKYIKLNGSLKSLSSDMVLPFIKRDV